MDMKMLDLCRRGSRVERMHTVPHLLPYSNGFHSANAALIAVELAKLEELTDRNIMLYMLLHDVAEVHTGDSPADVKRLNPELKQMLDGIELRWLHKSGIELPQLTPNEKAICKIADLTELGMHCLDELELGNRKVNHVLYNVIEYLRIYESRPYVCDLIEYFITKGDSNGAK